MVDSRTRAERMQEEHLVVLGSKEVLKKKPYKN
jgi:hypothetical protein